MKINKRIIDRLKFAANLCKGKRVLNIGGQTMPGCAGPFAKAHSEIKRGTKEYRIIDCQSAPSVNYTVDLNCPDSIPEVRKIISEYKPDVILCMELLEHINYHFELMQEMARSIEENKTEVFIDIPNNSNWVLNALGWNWDHSISFVQDVSIRFIMRSDLGKYDVTMYPCFQQYLWYWRLVYAIGFFRPFVWGFHINPARRKT